MPPTKLAASQAYVAFKQRLLLNLTNSCSAVVFVAEEDVFLVVAGRQWTSRLAKRGSGLGFLRGALQDAVPTCEYRVHFEEFAVVAAFNLNNCA